MTVISSKIILGASFGIPEPYPFQKIRSATISEKTYPFVIPKTDAVETIWQQFLKDSTEKIAGIEPKEAQIIFLGNIHTEKSWQNEWRGALIDHFAADQPIVLCEGKEAFEGIRPSRVSSFAARKKVHSYGWDNRVLQSSSTALIGVMQKLSDKYKENAPTTQWTEEDCAAWSKAVEKIRINCMIRTHSMIKTARFFLRKYVKPGQKLFVIAGSDHLFLSSAKYNVLDYFKAFKTTVILPKETRSNTMDTSIEYGKLLLRK